MQKLAGLAVFAIGSLFASPIMVNPVMAKTCVLAGGEATMVTKDLAEFMAKAALGNSIKDKGLKAEGVPKLTCNAPSPLTYCLAQQKACK
jgi:hypothetical protein